MSPPPIPPALPSAYEQPIVRIRFLDPQGRHQQSTLSSTWLEAHQHLASVCDAGSAESDAFRLATHDSARQFYEGLGCQVLSIERVSATIAELDGPWGPIVGGAA